MKIKGLKKAVGAYKRANEGGYYSPYYGRLMYDKSNGTLWTDEFYSLGHNSWVEYNSDSIVNLGAMMADEEIAVNMENVKEFIETHFK
jgi:hypothetical protein